MHPYFSVFGFDVPAYGLMAVLGGLVGASVVLLRYRRYATARLDTVNLIALCLVGALVGAKALYVLTQVPPAIRHWDAVVSHPLDALMQIFGGLVFYGGVLGALGIALWYIRKYKLPFWTYADLFAPAIPAAHMLGRIGCFLGGCCYGLPVTWGLTTTHSLAPEADGVARLPVQLMEAGLCLLMCLVLLWYERRKPRPGRVFALYLLLYAPARFVLEFFRGDSVRGLVLSVSTSQWISVLMFGLGLCLFLGKPAKLFTKREIACSIEHTVSPGPQGEKG